MEINCTPSYFTNILRNQTDGENAQTLFVFNVVVRGVLNCIVNFWATFLNVSSIIVICRNKNLQTTSNALVMSFSIGNSLSGVNGILTVVIFLRQKWTSMENSLRGSWVFLDVATIDQYCFFNGDQH